MRTGCRKQTSPAVWALVPDKRFDTCGCPGLAPKTPGILFPHRGEGAPQLVPEPKRASIGLPGGRDFCWRARNRQPLVALVVSASQEDENNPPQRTKFERLTRWCSL